MSLIDHSREGGGWGGYYPRVTRDCICGSKGYRCGSSKNEKHDELCHHSKDCCHLCKRPVAEMKAEEQVQHEAIWLKIGIPAQRALLRFFREPQLVHDEDDWKRFNVVWNDLVKRYGGFSYGRGGEPARYPCLVYTVQEEHASIDGVMHAFVYPEHFERFHLPRNPYVICKACGNSRTIEDYEVSADMIVRCLLCGAEIGPVQ